MKQTIDTEPSSLTARMSIADQIARQGDIVNATQIVEMLAAEFPHDWRIWEKLGELNARAGTFADAAAHFHRAVEQKRGDASLLYKLARATFDSGRPADAKVILDEGARLAPNHEAILRLYAEIYELGSNWDGLARTADLWLRAQPKNPLPWMFAATAQWETGHLSLAMQSFRTFLDRGGRNAANLATFGRLCMTALAYDEASRALDESERIDAECGHMLSAKATLLIFRGQFQDALGYARRAIKANPRDTAALKALVQISGGRITQGEFVQLKDLLDDSELPLQDRISAAFAVADCLDAQEDVEAAFAAYSRANDLSADFAKLEGIRFDRSERKRQTERLMSIFSSAPQSIGPHTQPIPIFVVGMPRSGTTLVESIIGAHSKVFACGERQAMRSIMQEFLASAPDRGIHGIPESAQQRWRDAYLRELPDLRGAIAVTDKNPWNFDALGLILELFPAARVIHVRRDAVETGLSIFRNQFPKFVSFANCLGDIGHYYGEYARLMAHWEAVLPGRFMTLQYEDLVSGFDDTAPDLLRFCGLEWEESCRNFTASERAIGTISAVQARQPLTGFKGRSSRYARHLSPLVLALREANVDLRSGTSAPGSSS
jgi:tetratricopeptide (TPR) repeat protein